MILRIEHIGVCAEEPRTLALWYREKLGFETVSHIPESNIWFLAAPGGMMLEVYPQKDGREQAASNATGGLRHIALETDDFERDCDLLTAKGVALYENTAVADGRKLRFFEDLEGNLWHLVWRRERMV